MSSTKLELLKKSGAIEFSVNKISIKANCKIEESTTTKIVSLINLGGDIVAKITDEQAKEVALKVNIKGFRPGKAPLNVVKSKYQDSINREALELMIDESVKAFVKEVGVNVSQRPQVDLEHFDDKELRFKVTLEFVPEINIPDFAKIKLEKPLAKIGSSEIDEQIEKIAKNYKDFKESPENHVAANGDCVVIDFEGKIDDVVFPGGSAKNHRLELGSNSFIDNFEAQLVGSRKGETKVVKVTFPKDYGSKQHAGKKAEFEVKVIDILTPQTLAIDDNFAQKFGLETLDALKEAVHKQLSDALSKIIRDKTKKELFDILIKQCDFDVPESMVNKEFDALWQQVEKEKPAEDEKLSEDERKKQYHDIALRRIKLGVLLSELGKVNNFTINNDDYSRAIMDHAKLFPGQEHAVLDYYRKNPKALANFQGIILEDKIVDYILSKVNLTDKEYTADQIREWAAS